ncbi:MAG: hypothetical protein ACI4JY_08150, partial [Oscillospiraceae bacterium]
MPVNDIYLADLNGDGYRVICSTASYSGLPGSYVCAYDFVSGSLYELSDSRGSYYITIDNDKLYYQFCANDPPTGIPNICEELTLAAMEKASTSSNTEANLAPEKIYPRNANDIDNILEINDDFSFTMPEFPNEEFSLKKGILYRGDTILFSGQPVHDIYLADLNGDGCREICSNISIGLSGVVDMHIAAFDLVNNSLYRLSGDSGSEYHITLEDGKIGYERSVYSIYGATVDQKGALDLSVMSKMIWVATKYETQEKTVPFKLYERGSSEYDNFSISLPEYPDCNFELRDNAFYINSKNVFSGAPINTIYLADLNGDGRREICAEAQMVWEPSVSGIIAVDCKSGEVYNLSKTGYNYTITINDGELCYEYRRSGNESSAPDSEGKLTLDIMGKG